MRVKSKNQCCRNELSKSCRKRAVRLGIKREKDEQLEELGGDQDQVLQHFSGVREGHRRGSKGAMERG